MFDVRVRFTNGSVYDAVAINWEVEGDYLHIFEEDNTVTVINMRAVQFVTSEVIDEG